MAKLTDKELDNKLQDIFKAERDVDVSMKLESMRQTILQVEPEKIGIWEKLNSLFKVNPYAFATSFAVFLVVVSFWVFDFSNSNSNNLLISQDNSVAMDDSEESVEDVLIDFANSYDELEMYFAWGFNNPGIDQLDYENENNFEL